MENRWSDAEAEEFVARYGAGAGVNADIALRVYTSRLIGADPRLVLHGGGNTSVKTRLPDLFGEDVDVLCVKGSGWDLDSIEPAGLPAVRLEPLRRLRALASLSDEDMVNAQRCNLLDSSAPNPSVETLLHAFLPHPFIDHTHSDAVLALTDQPDGAEICAEVYGGRAALVPYIMPGFALAKRAAEMLEDHPDVEGLILLKHGIFSFGATARESYDRMISLVSLAEARLSAGRGKVFQGVTLPDRLASVAEIAPILRGLTSISVDPAEGIDRPFILDFRTGTEVLNYVGGAELGRYGQAGVVTPDHAIRIKPWPLIAPAPAAGALDEFRAETAEALACFRADYEAYFARHNGRDGTAKQPLDSMPRVILVPGLGLFGLGKSAKDARIAADLAETTVRTVTDAEAIGRFESIAEGALFDIEYWSLEQAKLGK
ncbi:MAG: class II aldolase, partial [Alphaproteobacteria bacterium]